MAIAEVKFKKSKGDTELTTVKVLEWNNKRGWDIYFGIYKSFSLTVEEREALEQAIGDLFKKKFE